MTEHALCTRCVSQRNSYAFSRLEEERAMLWTKVFKVEAEPENHEQRKQNWLRHAEQDKMRGDLESRGSLVPTNLLTFIHSSLSIYLSLSGIGRESKLILSVSLSSSQRRRHSSSAHFSRETCHLPVSSSKCVMKAKKYDCWSSLITIFLFVFLFIFLFVFHPLLW